MKFFNYLLPAAALVVAAAATSCSSSNDNSQEFSYKLTAASCFVAYPQEGASAEADWKVAPGAEMTFSFDLNTPKLATLVTNPITYADGKTVRFSLENVPFSSPDPATGFRTIAIDAAQGFDAYGSAVTVSNFRFSTLLLTNGFNISLMTYQLTGTIDGAPFRVVNTQNLYYGTTTVRTDSLDVMGQPTKRTAYGITLDPKSLTATVQILNPTFSDSQGMDNQVMFSSLPFTVNASTVAVSQPNIFDVKMVPATTGAAPVDLPSEKAENFSATFTSTGIAAINFTYINSADTQTPVRSSVSFTGTLLPILAQ